MTAENILRTQTQVVDKHAECGSRAELRVGEFLISAAWGTPAVQQMVRHSTRTFEEIAGDGDQTDLDPAKVIGRIRSVVGLRGAIGVVNNAVADVATSEILNGDRAAMAKRLREIQAGLLEEKRKESMQKIKDQEPTIVSEVLKKQIVRLLLASRL